MFRWFKIKKRKDQDKYINGFNLGVKPKVEVFVEREDRLPSPKIKT